MKTLLYPGSFDPVTNGHMDIIRRASRLCDTLVVAVMHNPDKAGAFPVSKRVELLERACEGIGKVRVIAHGGLLVDCAAQVVGYSPYCTVEFLALLFFFCINCHIHSPCIQTEAIFLPIFIIIAYFMCFFYTFSGQKAIFDKRFIMDRLIMQVQ